MEREIIHSKDGYELDVHIFRIKDEKAVVQIIHGMEEHQERYEKLAKILNDNGYSAVSSDMRGHGLKAKDLGYFKDKNGYKELINDQLAITNYINRNFHGKKVYIFAHSMGTIITRVLLQNNSNLYDKVILSGYPYYQNGAYAGLVIGKVIKFFHGPKYKSKFVASLSIDSFNKVISNAKTNCDWISYNEDNVRAYIEDPYCGFGFSISAYLDLFKLVTLMHKVNMYKNVNQNLKLLLLRGLDDPCVGGDKGAFDSYNTLVKGGFTNIKRIDYPNMRHEILAENENKKVYEDIVSFYNE